MSAHLWFLWVVSGGAVATWVMMRVVWLKDPTPGVMGRYIGTLVAGIVGGVIGGGLAHTLAGSSDPMPGRGILGALAVSLIFSGGWAILGGGGGKTAR